MRWFDSTRGHRILRPPASRAAAWRRAGAPDRVSLRLRGHEPVAQGLPRRLRRRARPRSRCRGSRAAALRRRVGPRRGSRPTSASRHSGRRRSPSRRSPTRSGLPLSRIVDGPRPARPDDRRQRRERRLLPPARHGRDQLPAAVARREAGAHLVGRRHLEDRHGRGRGRDRRPELQDGRAGAGGKRLQGRCPRVPPHGERHRADHGLQSGAGRPHGGRRPRRRERARLDRPGGRREDGRVLFEWHSLDHVPITDTYCAGPRPVRLLPRQLDRRRSRRQSADLRAGTRRRCTRSTARAARCCGASPAGAATSSSGNRRVHVPARRPRAHPDGTITLFDDGPGPSSTQSRAIRLGLDLGAMRATAPQDYRHPVPIAAVAMGNAQVLEGDAVFVGWGTEPYLTEFGPAGDVRFDAKFDGGAWNYRAFRDEWVRQPATKPAVAATSRGQRGRVRELERQHRRRLTGASPRATRQACSRSEDRGGRNGFETMIRTARPAAVRLGDRPRRGQAAARRLPRHPRAHLDAAARLRCSRPRGRGGTGRRAGFRSRWASALGGSTPLARTLLSAPRCFTSALRRRDREADASRPTMRPSPTDQDPKENLPMHEVPLPDGPGSRRRGDRPRCGARRRSARGDQGRHHAAADRREGEARRCPRRRADAADRRADPRRLRQGDGEGEDQDRRPEADGRLALAALRVPGRPR